MKKSIMLLLLFILMVVSCKPSNEAVTNKNRKNKGSYVDISKLINVKTTGEISIKISQPVVNSVSITYCHTGNSVTVPMSFNEKKKIWVYSGDGMKKGDSFYFTARLGNSEGIIALLLDETVGWFEKETDTELLFVR